MPNKDEFGFGKHYFLLDKKLKDHIEHPNPHNIKKEDVGLGKIQNRPLKQEWIWEQEEEDSYASSLLVKEQIDRLDNKLPDEFDELPTEGKTFVYALQVKITKHQGKYIKEYYWEKIGEED